MNEPDDKPKPQPHDRAAPVMIWWGRSDASYSRNAVVRSALHDLGWAIHDYRPSKAVSLGLSAPRGLPTEARLIWVPCFRQRDVHGAARWARRAGIPLIFDPLISAYDKQVFEKQKFGEGSLRARRLCRWESRLFSKADVVIADTGAHATFFQQTLGVPAERCHVLPVSADHHLFKPFPTNDTNGRPLRVLFYGSFIALQGPETIVEAARLCPQAQWTLLGDGPLRASCERAASGLANVRFEPWIDYEKLPARIAEAEVLLGVFSPSEKAGRVVPNKVYQALACGRPVVTRRPLKGAYLWDTEQLGPEQSGIVFVEPGNPAALADAVRSFIGNPDRLRSLGAAAAQTFATYHAPSQTLSRLDALLRPWR